MRQYEMFELAFHGAEPEGSQVKVDVQAVFTLNGSDSFAPFWRNYREQG